MVLIGAEGERETERSIDLLKGDGLGVFLLVIYLCRHARVSKCRPLSPMQQISVLTIRVTLEGMVTGGRGSCRQRFSLPPPERSEFFFNCHRFEDSEVNNNKIFNVFMSQNKKKCKEYLHCMLIHR